MGRGLRGAKPAREWPKPLEGIEATRHYMYAFIASLKDCGHRPEHVKQVMRELLGRASIGDTPAPQSTEGGDGRFIGGAAGEATYGVKGTAAVEDRSHLACPFDDLPAWRDSAGVEASAGIEVTDAMVDAYLQANDAYWKRTDELPTPPNKWRTGTAREATRESLRAALGVPSSDGGQHG